MPRRLVVNGKKARQLRSKAKLTQQIAAVRLDLSESSLRRIESGSESVHLTTLGRVADFYGVKPEVLLRWQR